MKQFVILLILLAAFGSIPSVQAQDAFRSVHVESNFPEALVYADTLYIGAVDEGPFAISHSVSSLTVRPPLELNWTIQSVELSLSPELDTVVVHAPFEYHYSVQSMPFGSSVFSVDANGDKEYMGSTPTIVRSVNPISSLSVEHPLHGTQTLSFDSLSVWNRRFVTLQVPTSPDGELIVPSMITEKGVRKKRRWIDVAALGTAAVAGALAVHYKFEADERFDVYAKTGDPALQGGFQRYDDYSAIALGVMQAGIGVFAVRLVLR